VSPEKAALEAVWRNKRFWLVQSLLFAVWTAAALSWFWLPDSSVSGLALSAGLGISVLISGAWLKRRSVVFYGPSTSLRRAHLRPRLYADLVLLAAPGANVPYKLIGWHPRLAGLGMQTASLVVRFIAAYLLAVSAWLILASLVARLGTDSAADPAKSSSAPQAPRTAPSNP
jgi:hypothetical protein